MSRKIEFDANAFDDLAYWMQKDGEEAVGGAGGTGVGVGGVVGHGGL
jgi:hypothetical protein